MRKRRRKTRKKQHLWGEIFWEMLPQVQHIEAVVQRDVRVYLVLLTRLSHVVLVLKVMRSREAAAKLWEQLEEATGEAAASVALQAPGLKGSWRELRLGFMWQGQGS